MGSIDMALTKNKTGIMAAINAAAEQSHAQQGRAERTLPKGTIGSVRAGLGGIQEIETAPESRDMSEWRTQLAPKIARGYWHLGENGTVLDMMYAIRADEAEHRDVNHVCSGLTPEQPNPLFNPDLLAMRVSCGEHLKCGSRLSTLETRLMARLLSGMM